MFCQVTSRSVNAAMKNAGKQSLVRNDLPIENKLANDDLTSGTVCAVKRGERK